MTRCYAVMFALSLAGVPTAAAQNPSYPLPDAPEKLRPAIAKAEAVFGELQKALTSALGAEMKAGGPVRALAVCHTEAEPIARRVADESGIRVGRTSERLRNPKNAAPVWAAPFIRATSSARASDAAPIVVDLGDRAGVLRPIPTAQVCTACHGAPDHLAAEVREKLHALYPEDKAVGFKEGDLRGWMWAEVPLARK